MKLISWNVNGIRAAIGKGFLDFFDEKKPDILCLQETKISEGQLDLELEGYTSYFNYAEKKGYSGTAVYTRIKPVNVTYGLGIEEHDHEGRVITIEFAGCYVVNVYTPNAQRGLERLPYRMSWEDAFRAYLLSLDKRKPVIVCGDLNVAHMEIDIKNPKSNRQSAGFSDEERGKFSELLETGFLDTFRVFYPDKKDAYTWWSYMFKAREKNVGWRIDYFCVSKSLKDQIKDAAIHADVMGSDHCPVELLIEDAPF
jgi:exodeoxyribonuclease-3